MHYRSSLRNIFVHLFCGTTTKRIIGVEAWRLVSMVKKDRRGEKKEEERLERGNKFAKSVSTKWKRQKRFLPFLILKIGNLFFFPTWELFFFCSSKRLNTRHFYSGNHKNLVLCNHFNFKYSFSAPEKKEIKFHAG